MDAGTQIDDQCIIEFRNIKLNKAYRYIIYVLDENQKVTIDKLGARDSTYEQFVEALPKNEARYAVFDYEFNTKDNPPRHVQRLVLFLWSPDTLSVKFKMTYATGKESLKKKLDGIQREVQANGLDDLDRDNVQSLVQ